MSIFEFYQDGKRLLAKDRIDQNNFVVVEIERETDDGIVKNEAAYERYAKEIAEFKAGGASADDAEQAPAPRQRPRSPNDP